MVEGRGCVWEGARVWWCEVSDMTGKVRGRHMANWFYLCGSACFAISTIINMVRSGR